MFNFIDFVFLNFALFVALTGFLINYFEKYVPKVIIQTFLYGCFSYKGEKASIVKQIEIPKSAFRHYYVFSAFFGASLFVYMLFVYYFASEVPWEVQECLKLLLSHRRPSVCVSAAVVAMFCLTLQCFRRLYETCCVQVFAKSSKMNLTHYIAGLFHYFGCLVTILGHAPLFAGETKVIKYLDTYTAIILLPCLLLFSKGWVEQFNSNKILARLRKDDKTNKVVTEEHKVPSGGWFELVSSPHRLTEVMMYTALLFLVPTKTFLCIYIWVIANQVQTSVQAHWWYQATFKNYPKNRCAIFPYIY